MSEKFKKFLEQEIHVTRKYPITDSYGGAFSGNEIEISIKDGALKATSKLNIEIKTDDDKFPHLSVSVNLRHFEEEFITPQELIRFSNKNMNFVHNFTYAPSVNDWPKSDPLYFRVLALGLVSFAIEKVVEEYNI